MISILADTRFVCYVNCNFRTPSKIRFLLCKIEILKVVEKLESRNGARYSEKEFAKEKSSTGVLATCYFQ